MSTPTTYQVDSEYQSINHEYTYPSTFDNIKKNRVTLGFIALGLLGIASVFSIGYTIGNNNTNQISNFTSKHRSLTRPCNALECLNFACDRTVNPFVCAQGVSTGGCSPLPEVWDNKELCDNSCTLAHCDKNTDVINEDDLFRKCLECDEAQCTILKEHYYQACSSENPYVCVSDGENFLGCSNSKYHWETMSEAKCSSCCDNRSCLVIKN
jgi:hypothetical protein